ncbi:hypothetical protein [Embleya sp. NBC_00896]|uniref:hypothetical protein n=1 Tax=Embleya sp. NBC_00896 TaxID=2975961 RepID=UPI002F90B9BA|nr:hypothetical protein OG928_40060 [Embleya sp. NBC_00896]
MGRPIDWSGIDRTTDPVPGDVAAVTALAAHFKLLADRAETAERQVASLRDGIISKTWKGDSVEVYAQRFDKVPEDLRKIAESHHTAAAALTAYAAELDKAQQQAGTALTNGGTAKSAQATHRTEVKNAGAAVTTAKSHVQTLQQQAAAGTTVPPQDMKAATDAVQSADTRQSTAQTALNQADNQFKAAQTLLTQAEGIRDTAAKTASKQLHDASHQGIRNLSWWAKLNDWFHDKVVPWLQIATAVLGILALILGGPLVWIVLAIGAVILLNTIVEMTRGRAGWGDLFMAVLDVLPGMKGITAAIDGIKVATRAVGLAKAARGLERMAAGMRGINFGGRFGTALKAAYKGEKGWKAKYSLQFASNFGSKYATTLAADKLNGKPVDLFSIKNAINATVGGLISVGGKGFGEALTNRLKTGTWRGRDVGAAPPRTTPRSTRAGERDAARADGHRTAADDIRTRRADNEAEATRQRAAADTSRTAADAHTRDAETHTRTAEGHQAKADGHQETARRHGEEAERRQQAADDHGTRAGEHRDAETGHRSDAAGHDKDAARHGTDAKEHQDAATGHRNDADTHDRRADDLKSRADDHDRAAAGHRTEADNHARDAARHEERARTDPDNAAEHRAKAAESSRHAQEQDRHASTEQTRADDLRTQSRTASDDAQTSREHAQRSDDAAAKSQADRDASTRHADDSRTAADDAKTAAKSEQDKADTAKREAADETRKADDAKREADNSGRQADRARDDAQTGRDNAATARKEADDADRAAARAQDRADSPSEQVREARHDARAEERNHLANGRDADGRPRYDGGHRVTNRVADTLSTRRSFIGTGINSMVSSAGGKAAELAYLQEIEHKNVKWTDVAVSAGTGFAGGGMQHTTERLHQQPFRTWGSAPLNGRPHGLPDGTRFDLAHVRPKPEWQLERAIEIGTKRVAKAVPGMEATYDQWVNTPSQY